MVNMLLWGLVTPVGWLLDASDSHWSLRWLKIPGYMLLGLAAVVPLTVWAIYSFFNAVDRLSEQAREAGFHRGQGRD